MKLIELRIDPIPVICKLNIAISIELDVYEKVTIMGDKLFNLFQDLQI